MVDARFSAVVVSNANAPHHVVASRGPLPSVPALMSHVGEFADLVIHAGSFFHITRRGWCGDIEERASVFGAGPRGPPDYSGACHHVARGKLSSFFGSYSHEALARFVGQQPPFTADSFVRAVPCTQGGHTIPVGWNCTNSMNQLGLGVVVSESAIPSPVCTNQELEVIL